MGAEKSQRARRPMATAAVGKVGKLVRFRGFAADVTKDRRRLVRYQDIVSKSDRSAAKMVSKQEPNAGKSSPNRGKRFPAEPLTADEVERLLGAITGNGALAVRNRALIALLWRSGLRVSEALALRPSDVEAGKINVRNGKGSKQRMATYDRYAVGYLSAWEGERRRLGLNGRQPLFCSVSSGKERAPGHRINPSYIRQLLPKLAQRAGIDKRVHAHGLRHTHASELAQERLRLPAIAAQLGHASTATTDAYLKKITAADLQEDMAAIGRTID